MRECLLSWSDSLIGVWTFEAPVQKLSCEAPLRGKKHPRAHAVSATLHAYQHGVIYSLKSAMLDVPVIVCCYRPKTSDQWMTSLVAGYRPGCMEQHPWSQLPQLLPELLNSASRADQSAQYIWEAHLDH